MVRRASTSGLRIDRNRRRSRHRPPARREARGAGDTQLILRHWRDAVPDDRMAHLIKDATRALVRALQLRLAPLDVSFGHWAFLRILWETDGLTQRELSREAGVMEPTTFAALKAMQRRGYIRRHHLPGNRRKVHIFLTAKGHALKQRLVPLAEEVNRLALRGVRAADTIVVRRTLLAVIANLAADEARFADAGRPSQPQKLQSK
jgi:DNA-binding MarR family transcriptional regulator